MGDSSQFSSSPSSVSSFLGSFDTESSLSDTTRSLPCPPIPCPTGRGGYDRKASPMFFCTPVSSAETDLRSRHFLDTCFLCKQPIRGVSDVFMYAGDAPFFSEECRQEQMEMDVALEKCRKLRSSDPPLPLSLPSPR